MSFTPNLVVGLVITLTGAALLLDRLGALEARTLFRFWPVLLMAFGISVVIQALKADAPGEQGDANWRRGGRPIVGPGLVLFLAIVWLANANGIDRRLMASGGSGDPELRLLGVMARDARVSAAQAFEGAQMTSVMGGSTLDLRQASIPAGQTAIVDVFAMMGGSEIVMPSGWTVTLDVVTIFAAAVDKRLPSVAAAASDATAPHVIIRGTLVFSGLTIKN